MKSRAGQPTQVEQRKTNEQEWINRQFGWYNVRVKVHGVANVIVHNQSRTFGKFR